MFFKYHWVRKWSLRLKQYTIHTIKVVTNHGDYHADLVVSNADPSYFYKSLLRKSPKKIFNKPYVLKHSMGLFVFYFSTSKIYDDVQHHTIIFNKRHKDLLKDIFDNKVYINDPSLYLHRPSATDKKNIQYAY